MISLRHPQRSPLVRLLARGLIGLLVLAGAPLEVWAERFDPPLSATKTPMGNRESATDDRGTTTYAYDNRNRLETLTYPDGRKLTYGYDANSNRTSLTAEVGGQVLTTSYSYDELNRLQTVTDSEGRDYVHEYDPNGNRQKLTYPNNTETSYVYDDLNRLTNLTTINTATLGMIQSYQYTLGAAGNREQIDEHDGTARVYTYDDLYRLEKERVSDSVGLVYEKSFVYDPVGNRQSQTTTGTGAPGTPLAPGTIDYTYDDRDRILTEGTQPYGWDENGSLVTKDGEASYTWDFENRLTRVQKADGTVVTHAYDADGNRVRTEVTPAAGPPVSTEFLVDPSGSLTHVVAETTDSGTLIAQYVRGVDLLSVIRPTETRYFHADGLGSIRRLTSEAGTITDGYTYTAFGDLVAHTGGDVQPYAFTAEPLDPNSGFQYHRARWLDLRDGRFVSVDPFGGMPTDPLTLHRYLYARANPIDNVDPSGLLFSNFLWGRRVHQLIGEHFLAITPGIAHSDRAISTILGFTVRPFGRVRPDLVDESGTQVYEIKPFGTASYLDGVAQLTFYLGILNAMDPLKRTWRRGTTYIPPTTLHVDYGVVAFVSPPFKGIIAYEVNDLRLQIGSIIFAVAASMIANHQQASSATVTQLTSLTFAFGGI